jgi:hypothetical protein
MHASSSSYDMHTGDAPAPAPAPAKVKAKAEAAAKREQEEAAKQKAAAAAKVAQEEAAKQKAAAEATAKVFCVCVPEYGRTMGWQEYRHASSSSYGMYPPPHIYIRVCIGQCGERERERERDVFA